MTTFGKIGFIGAGNMGSCLIGGLLKQRINASDILVTDHHLQTCQSLSEKWGVTAIPNASDVVSNADILVLAIKPQQMKPFLTEMAAYFNPDKTMLISIAAGITTTQIKQWIKQSTCQLVRAMPNTPALLGVGITGLYATQHVLQERQAQAQSLLNAVGETVWLNDESLMDVVTALSGSGPAYFFYLMESLIKGAVTLGLPEDIASKLTLQTALGSATMALHAQPTEDVAQLRAKVTSPGGTTEEGIKVLKDGKLEDLITKTLSAAAKRGKTLSQQYD